MGRSLSRDNFAYLGGAICGVDISPISKRENLCGVCGLDVGVGVQLKNVKVTSYIAQYPFLRKMCQLIKYHPAICAVRLHLVHRESYLTTKQGGNIENNSISIYLAQ